MKAILASLLLMSQNTVMYLFDYIHGVFALLLMIIGRFIIVSNIQCESKNPPPPKGS